MNLLAMSITAFYFFGAILLWVHLKFPEYLYESLVIIQLTAAYCMFWWIISLQKIKDALELAREG